MVTVPAGEGTQEAQQLPQNDNHDDDHEDEEEEEGNEDVNKEDADYTPLSDSEKEKVYHDAEEIKTVRNEASIPTGRLRDLLNCININNQLTYVISAPL
jgi:hypothetical protein